jgi:trans-aconitate 2-methyltransferase
LKPFVDRLPQDLQRSYIAEYQRQIEAAYPVQTDGKRLLAFPRIFFVARKGMPQ